MRLFLEVVFLCITGLNVIDFSFIFNDRRLENFFKRDTHGLKEKVSFK